MKKEKNVYIVLSFTKTALSYLIRLGINCEFSHSSISLDEDLKKCILLED